MDPLTEIGPPPPWWVTITLWAILIASPFVLILAVVLIALLVATPAFAFEPGGGATVMWMGRIMLLGMPWALAVLMLYFAYTERRDRWVMVVGAVVWMLVSSYCWWGFLTTTRADFDGMVAFNQSMNDAQHCSPRPFHGIVIEGPCPQHDSTGASWPEWVFWSGLASPILPAFILWRWGRKSDL